MIQNQSLISRANGVAPMEGLGTELNRTKNLLKCYYDFAVQGGAFGASVLPLFDDQGNLAFLPQGAMITRSFTRTITALTSGGAATLAVQALAGGDVLAATAYTSFSAANVLVEGVSTGTAATMKGPILTPITDKYGNPGGGIGAVIATAAITAGKVAVYIEYVL